VGKALTADGSKIADWDKSRRMPFRSPSGPSQVPFCYNSTTGSVFYGLDYKAVFIGGYRNAPGREGKYFFRMQWRAEHYGQIK
jgi:hypothetical protein